MERALDQPLERPQAIPQQFALGGVLARGELPPHHVGHLDWERDGELSGRAHVDLRTIAVTVATPDAAVNKGFTRSKSSWLTYGTGAQRTVSESATSRDSSFVPYKPLYLNRFWTLDGRRSGFGDRGRSAGPDVLVSNRRPPARDPHRPTDEQAHAQAASRGSRSESKSGRTPPRSGAAAVDRLDDGFSDVRVSLDLEEGHASPLR
jgi:hypothetical protein